MEFEDVADETLGKGPLVWTENYGGFWVIGNHKGLSAASKKPELFSSDHDPEGQRGGPQYQGNLIPEQSKMNGGFIESDPPTQLEYRRVLNPYFSPAAVQRWRPLTIDVTRACLDDVVETGRIDFVEDLANIVPAVLTMAMAGLPLADWYVYSEPIHAFVYTPKGSPDAERVDQLLAAMFAHLQGKIDEARVVRRPGLLDALMSARIEGAELTNEDVQREMFPLIAGGLDSNTALIANTLEWLGDHPDERARLQSDPELVVSATEEFLRIVSPVRGNARTVTEPCRFAGSELVEGDRVYLAWAIANRDPSVFDNPHNVVLDRPHNRHVAFGAGVHRCIGAPIARMTFQVMLSEVVSRLPDYRCDPSATIRYDTIGVINGMKRLEATFSPGKRQGPSLAETLARLQDELNTSDAPSAGAVGG